MPNSDEVPENPVKSSTNVDLIIEARYVVSMSTTHRLLENHAVLIQAGLIVEVLPISEARQKYTATSLVCLDDHVLIPGLINLHSHAAMSMMRGIADDLPLMTWLEKHIWPDRKSVV